MMCRRAERIDAEGAEALLRRRGAEEVTKAGRCRRLGRVARIELGSSERGCVSDVVQNHQTTLTLGRGAESAKKVVKLS